MSGRVAERRGFHYLHKLWNRWAAPGLRLPEDHWREVREVMERSWPVPLEHYRKVAFTGPVTLIPTSTLYLSGDRDGFVEMAPAKGQRKCFSGPFEERIVEGAGHFPHLEKPEIAEPLIVDWLTRN